MAYSSKTKEGNWCEDAFGAILVQNRVISKLAYDTETTANYIPPKDMKDTTSSPGLVIESVYDLKAKNKDGLSYNLLFGHGCMSKDRFVSSRASPEGSLHKRKLANNRKEMKSASAYTTQSRLANALMHQQNNDFPVPERSGPFEEIPDFRRTFPMSDANPRWF
jgi:hypothetical protein